MKASAARFRGVGRGRATGTLDEQHLQRLLQQQPQQRVQLEQQHAEQQQPFGEHLEQRQVRRVHLRRQQVQRELVQRQEVQRQQMQRQQVQRQHAQLQQRQLQQLQQLLRQWEQQEQREQLLLQQQRMQRPPQQLLVQHSPRWRGQSREQPPPQQQEGVTASHETWYFSGEGRGALCLGLSSEAATAPPSRLLGRWRFTFLAVNEAPCDTEGEQGEEGEGVKQEDDQEEDDTVVDGETEEWEDGGEEGADVDCEYRGGPGGAGSGAGTVFMGETAAAAPTGGAATGATVNGAETTFTYTGMSTGLAPAAATAPITAAVTNVTSGAFAPSSTFQGPAADMIGSALPETTPTELVCGCAAGSNRNESGTSIQRSTDRWLALRSPIQQQELDNCSSSSSGASTAGDSSAPRNKRFCPFGPPESAFEGGQETNDGLINGSTGGGSPWYGRTGPRPRRNRYGCPSCNNSSSSSSRSDSESGDDGNRMPLEGRNFPLSPALDSDSDVHSDDSGSRSDCDSCRSHGSSVREVIELDSDDDDESSFVRRCVAPAVAVGEAAPTGVGEYTSAVSTSHWDNSSSISSRRAGSRHSNTGGSTGNNWNNSNGNGCNVYGCSANGSRPFDCSIRGTPSPREDPRALLFPLRQMSCDTGMNYTGPAAHYDLETDGGLQTEAAGPAAEVMHSICPGDIDTELCASSLPPFWGVTEDRNGQQQLQCQAQPQVQQGNNQHYNPQQQPLRRQGRGVLRSGVVTYWGEQNGDGFEVAGSSLLRRPLPGTSSAFAARETPPTATVAHAGTVARGSTAVTEIRAASGGQMGAHGTMAVSRASGASHAVRAANGVAAMGTRLTPLDRSTATAVRPVGTSVVHSTGGPLALRESDTTRGTRVVPSRINDDALSAAARAALVALERILPMTTMQPFLPQAFDVLQYIPVPPGLEPVGLPQLMQHEWQLQQLLAEQQLLDQQTRIPPILRPPPNAGADVTSSDEAATEVTSRRQTRLVPLPLHQLPQPHTTMIQADAAVTEANSAIEDVLRALQRHQQLFGDGPSLQLPQQRGTPPDVLEQLPILPFRRRASVCSSMRTSSSTSRSRNTSSSGRSASERSSVGASKRRNSSASEGRSSTTNSSNSTNGGTGEVGDRDKCAVCLELFVEGQMVRFLPCLHFFHVECVDTWLELSDTCPICKWPVHCTALPDEAFVEAGSSTASSPTLRDSGGVASPAEEGFSFVPSIPSHASRAVVSITGDGSFATPLLTREAGDAEGALCSGATGNGAEDASSEDDAYGSAYAQ